MRKSAIVGLLSGLAVVILTLIAVGIVNLPEAEGAVGTKLRGTDECHAIEVAQDQGYAITRNVVHDVCNSAN